MQSSIYLIITFVAFTAAKQLKLGPHVFPEQTATSLNNKSQQPNKRYSQGYTLYFTPDEIKDLQRFKTFENIEKSQSPKEIPLDQQSEGEQLKWYKSQFLTKEPQLEIRGLGAYGTNFQNYNSESNIQLRNFQYPDLYPGKSPQDGTDVVKSLIEKANNYDNNNNWQKVQEDNTKPENDYESAYDLAEKAKSFGNYFWQKQRDDVNKQENDSRNDSILKSYQILSAENQDDNNQLNNKLKQQWNRILEHNRAQLKSITSIATDSQEVKQTKKSAEQTQSRSEIDKEIENILKNHRDFELSRQRDTQDSQEEEIDQRRPIFVQKEVSVTKHLPVPFVKEVKVAVPTPVLVPVPEPFEVKNSRLHSVPLHNILRYFSSER